MTKVSFQTSDFSRKVANSASLTLKNRYFEKNPSLTDDGASLIARPGMRMLATMSGTPGPIRGMGTEPGSFNGDLFVASGNSVVRMTSGLVQTILFSGLFNPDLGVVNFAITGAIGTTPAFCFIADGRNLFVYTDNGYASGVLTGTPANGDVVQMGGIYYEFTTGAVGTNGGGTTDPAGTSALPYLVALGTAPIDPFTNLFNAVNSSGADGTDYTADIIANANIKATNYTITTLTVRATIPGTPGDGNSTTETGAAMAWGSATLTGGGMDSFSQVQIPDDVGAIDVAVINSYVIVVPVQDGIAGQFYWIKPGETTIDPLDFATAERSPDAIYGVQVFGDQFWLPGESTTEVWYVSGNPDAPMERLQGVVYDRGSWENTAKAIHEQMVIVDAYGGVFVVQGGAPSRVSTPGIEEEVRQAITFQRHREV